MNFADLDLDQSLLDAIGQANFHKPTPIQAAAIPELLAGKDVLAGAATGTGKTAAFVLPMLQKLIDFPDFSRWPRVLILAPTRELALQTRKVVRELSRNMQLRSVLITGGFSEEKQLEMLRQDFQVLVATPGRLLKLLEQEMIELDNIEMLIIDEADRMLDIGLGPDVYQILEHLHQEFQAGLFSATLDGSGIRKFAANILEEPVLVQVDAANEQSAQIQQLLYFANDRLHKQELLKVLLNDPSCQSAIVFCNKKERAIELTDWLLEQEITAEVLHGDFVQAKRLEKIKKFRNQRIKALVATDVAARGLDLTNITHVINFDFPLRGDVYIHRTGRTGRAQNVGIAISLVEGHELKNLERIEYHLQTKIPVGKIPGLEASVSRKTKPKKRKKAKKK